MPRPLSKKDIDILEERGYWKASSSLHKRLKRLIRKNLSLSISYVKDAHRIIFVTANQSGMAGRYRRDNPELKRIDSTLLKLSHWQKIPSDMADLDFELREATKNIKKPEKEKEYQGVILTAVKLSHHLMEGGPAGYNNKEQFVPFGTNCFGRPFRSGGKA